VQLVVTVTPTKLGAAAAEAGRQTRLASPGPIAAAESAASASHTSRINDKEDGVPSAMRRLAMRDDAAARFS
jgi:hypothetical protein